MDEINVPFNVDYQTKPARKPTYLKTNIFGKLFFTWVSDIIFMGTKQPFQQSMHYGLRDEEDSKKNFEKFKYNWCKKKNIFKALWATYYSHILIAYSATLIFNIFQCTTPYFIYNTINYLDPEQDPSTKILWGIDYGIILIVQICISRLIIAMLESRCNFFWSMVSVNMTNGLNGMIYHKALNFSLINSEKHSTGMLVNHMQVDTMKLNYLFQTAAYSINFPLQLPFVFFCLYYLAGLAFIPGIFILFITVICAYYASGLYFRSQKKIMESKDKRIRMITEILNNIKFIKMSGWEKCMQERLVSISNKELSDVSKSFAGLVINTLLNWVTPMAIPTSLYIYVTLSGHALPTTASFTIYSLSILLQQPYVYFSRLILSCSESAVALRRVSNFLLAEEVDTTYIQIIKDEQNDKAITIKNGNFFWVEPKNKTDNSTNNNTNDTTMQSPSLANDQENRQSKLEELYILRDINLEIQKNKFMAIIGDVGSGKSSFFYSLVGEMKYSKDAKPSVIINGNISFSPQKPWILNDSVKNNILFGEQYSEERYRDAILYSCLEPDLKILSHGDATEIGEKGLNLSGGQKARVALARALYSHRDIYFFDDPLSAVDAHVGTAIVQNCFLKYLKKKTIILATHNIDCLRHADRVIILDKGKIVADGTYEEISKLRIFLEIVEKAKKNESITENKSQRESFSRTSILSTGKEKEKLVHEFDDAFERLKIPSEIKPSVLSVEPQEVSEPLVLKEDKQTGSVGFGIYKQWIAYNGGWCAAIFIMLLGIIWLFSLISSSYALSKWSQAKDQESIDTYLEIYIILVGLFIIILSIRPIILFCCSIKCSKILNKKIMHNILRAPVNLFFDRVPMGRILNRLSKDLTIVDVYLSYSLSVVMASFIMNLSDLIVCIGVGSIYALPLFLAFFAFVYVTRGKYMQLNREAVRFEGITRSPIISFFSETLNGLAVIRCLGDEQRFFDKHITNQNENIKNQVLISGLTGWFFIRISLASMSLVIIFNALCIFEPSMILQTTLVIYYSFRITGDIQYLLLQSADFENKIISFERCLAFTDITPEREEHAPNLKAIENYTEDWPSQGKIEFNNYCVKYRPGLPKVLNKISITIQPKEKIGIVGRTGSGKSTLFLSITRILEAHSGSISIDGVKIDSLGLTDLRNKITVIPQDAMIFKGSIRDNLDILHEYTDDQIWRALQMVCLKEKFEKEGLDADIKDDGDNLSAGEKQLLSIGRAILRQNKIILIDEATSNIDTRTELAIMDTIRNQLRNCTVLTIAHRLKTVIDSDKILFMDHGKILEFDTPGRLLSNKNSKFYALWEEAQKTGSIIDQMVTIERLL